jgi:hypothetical protein
MNERANARPLLNYYVWSEYPERKTRFELATLALARRCSTAELLPRAKRKRRLAPTVFTYAGGRTFLAGNGHAAANARSMTDQALLGTVLFIGGGVYLVIFVWITQSRVRDLGPDKKPDHGGH